MMGRGHSWLGDLTPEPGGAAEVLPAYLSQVNLWLHFLLGPCVSPRG